MKTRCLIGKINEISSFSDVYIAKRIKELNLPILRNHIPLFYILPEDGSALLFNEIASSWKISKSSLSDIINKYENINLINKCTCNEDKRSVYISLTKEAVEIKHKLEEIEDEFLDLLLVDFTEDERKIFEYDLDKALKSGRKIIN